MIFSGRGVSAAVGEKCDCAGKLFQIFSSEDNDFHEQFGTTVGRIAECVKFEEH